MFILHLHFNFILDNNTDFSVKLLLLFIKNHIYIMTKLHHTLFFFAFNYNAKKYCSEYMSSKQKKSYC